jgi:hypothetical protein
MIHAAFRMKYVVQHLNCGEVFSDSKGEGTSKKLATATQLQLPKNVTYFKCASGFQIGRRTLRKLMFD